MGVCLGYQSIGVAFGAEVKRIDPPVHGKLSMIQHECGLMAGCSNPVAVTRYHSLVLDKLPDCFDITAETDSIVMGISHQEMNLRAAVSSGSIASVNIACWQISSAWRG